MNRRQALLSRRVVRFCKPSLVAIKDIIPEEATLDNTTPMMKAERPSLIDLTDYPDHPSPSRRYQRRLGRRGCRAGADETSEKHIDLTHQGETLDDRPKKKEAGIISVATLSPNAMMLKRRTALEEGQATSPKLSYAYRSKSPARTDTAPREQRVEHDDSHNKDQDHREPSHHPGRRRAWKRLFIDTSAMKATQASTQDRTQDFLSAFSYEFKKPRNDTDGDHSDIIVLDDILPFSHGRNIAPSAHLPVASPYHETFGTAKKEASLSSKIGSPEVRRADMTHATQLHLQKQAARIDSIRQRAKELQRQRRIRPTPEWRPEALVDFASQDLQGKKNDKDADGTYSWLSPTGHKALKFRKARKAAEESSSSHDLDLSKTIKRQIAQEDIEETRQLQELRPVEFVEEQNTHEVSRGDSKDATIEIESIISNESETKKEQPGRSGQGGSAVGTTSVPAGVEVNLGAEDSNKNIIHSNDAGSMPTSPCSYESIPLSTGSNRVTSAPPGDVESSPLSEHSHTSTSRFVPDLTIDTNLAQYSEPHFVSPDESQEEPGDHTELRGHCSPARVEGGMSAFQYISPVSDSDFSQHHFPSPRSLANTEASSQMELNYSLSASEQPTMSTKENKISSKLQAQAEKVDLESQDSIQDVREPQQSQYERNEESTPKEILSDNREDYPDDQRDDYQGEMNGLHDELDLPQCLTESTRHGLDAIDADYAGEDETAGEQRIGSCSRGLQRNKVDELQLDDQSYSSWSIKPKVSFPSGVEVDNTPFHQGSSQNDAKAPEENGVTSEDDIDDIQEVNTNDLMTIMEEATSNIKANNLFTRSSPQEWDRIIDDMDEFYPEEERHSPHRPTVMFHEDGKGDNSPSSSTHELVRRSRFNTHLISPKSTKSTDTSTSGDNAGVSDFYRMENYQESFDSLEFADTNAYRTCSAPPLIYHLLDSTCVWLEGIHCFFCFQAPLFGRPKKKGRKNKVQGIGSSAQSKKSARPSSPRGEGSVSSRRRQQHRARSSDERSKRSARSSPKSTKERRTQRSRGESHVHFSGHLIDQQQINYMNVEMLK